MNRAKIKNDAKKMIEGNLWTILKPMLIVMIILGFVNVISEKVLQQATFVGTICSALLLLAGMPLSYGLDVFILKYVRKEQVDYDEIFKHYSKFVPIVLLGLLMLIIISLPYLIFAVPGILVANYYSKFVPMLALGLYMYIYNSLCSLLSVIPCIIAAILYSQAMFIMIDGEEKPVACIKKSKEMMYGYKWDYFVFMLSFFGWYLLCVLTMGIAIAYVAPYVSVSKALYYEELKKITKN